MNIREQCVNIIEHMPDEQLPLIMAVLESARKIIEEMADDAFCAKMYENYLENPDKGDAVDFEDFARSIGVNIP